MSPSFTSASIIDVPRTFSAKTFSRPRVMSSVASKTLSKSTLSGDGTGIGWPAAIVPMMRHGDGAGAAAAERSSSSMARETSRSRRMKPRRSRALRL